MGGLEILNAVMDARNYTAGGGSASALAGGMAAGMLAMAANLSVGKDCGLTDAKYRELAAKGERLAKELLEGARADAAAFGLIKAAYGMKKDTEAAKEARRRAIADAFVGAARAPRDNARKCREAELLGELLTGRSNPSAASDVQCAMLLARAGLNGCILNIEVNLKSIQDENITAELKKEINGWRKAQP